MSEANRDEIGNGFSPRNEFKERRRGTEHSSYRARSRYPSRGFSLGAVLVESS